MKIDEPLPCPFCGKPPLKHIVSGNYGYTPNKIEIKCVECHLGFASPTEGYDWEKRNHTDLRVPAEQEVTARWNRRSQ